MLRSSMMDENELPVQINCLPLPHCASLKAVMSYFEFVTSITALTHSVIH